MLLNWFDPIGDWNPQLLRELKGRLKPRNVMLAIALALVAQVLLLGYFYNLLPPLSQETVNYYGYTRYCFEKASSNYPPYECAKDAAGFIIVNWRIWWRDLFVALNWIVTCLLMVPGVYLLITDLDQEERKGTLNFIRLSPQSSQSILLGKLLGIPTLLYLVVLMLVPLHLIAAFRSDASIRFVISFYVILTAACFFLYSLALLCGFLGKLQVGLAGSQFGSGLALVAMLFTSSIFIPAFVAWNAGTTWNSFTEYMSWYGSREGNLEWFYLPLSQNIIFAHAFTLLNLGVGSYAVWQALRRCFHNPSATIISKKQSYALVASCEVLMLGFCLQAWGDDMEPKFPLIMAIAVLSVTLVGFLALIAMLSNHRQTLLDWARYRHVEAKKGQQPSGKRVAFFQSAVMQDLIWGERSPAVVAIAINLLITAAILLPWMLLFPNASLRIQAVLGLVLSLNLIAIYAAIAQLMLMMKTPKRTAWAASAVGSTALLPALVALVLTKGAYEAIGGLFLFSPFLWISLYNHASLPTVGLAILGQWTVLVLLNLRLTQQLKLAGESASKALLTGGVKS